MFRYEKIFGGRMCARKDAYENVEVQIKCKILNQFVEILPLDPHNHKVAVG